MKDGKRLGDFLPAGDFGFNNHRFWFHVVVKKGIVDVTELYILYATVEVLK